MNGNWDGVLIPTDDSAEREEADDQLIKLAMSKLSVEEQGLLRLKYQDEVSVKELAIHYSVTESAVKMRLKRSRDRLRDMYQQVAVV